MIKHLNIMKKNWGNERTLPEFEVKDAIYNNMKETCMVLKNNQKVHGEVNKEMQDIYKEKLMLMVKQHKNELWIQSKMPKVKKIEKFILRQKDEEESSDYE